MSQLCAYSPPRRDCQNAGHHTVYWLLWFHFISNKLHCGSGNCKKRKTTGSPTHGKQLRQHALDLIEVRPPCRSGPSPSSSWTSNQILTKSKIKQIYRRRVSIKIVDCHKSQNLDCGLLGGCGCRVAATRCRLLRSRGLHARQLPHMLYQLSKN